MPIADVVAKKLAKEVLDGNKMATSIAIFLAAFLDFADLLLIGQIPYVGTALKICGSITLTLILMNVGGFIRLKVRALVLIATILEVIPVVATIPTYTLSMLWAHHKIKQRAAEAQKKLKQLEENIQNVEMPYEIIREG